MSTHPHEGVVKFFWDLADIDENKRVDATSELIAYLVDAQKVAFAMTSLSHHL